jgi:hypothetical protein
MVKSSQWSCKQACRFSNKWVATTIGLVNSSAISGGATSGLVGSLAASGWWQQMGWQTTW